MSVEDRLVVVADDPRYDADRLREVLGCRVETADCSTPEAIEANAADADALVVNVHATVPKSVIESLDLTVLARGAVGLDGIDVAAAADHGVQVVHVPEYCLDEVADHAVGLLTSLARGIPAYADRAREAWDWQPPYPIERLAECTVGVVSFGPIAQRFTDRITPSVDNVVVHDPYVDDDVIHNHGAESVSFEALCRRADHLSVHAPLTEDTRGMIDADTFTSLPTHAVVVNTGRGGVVDEDDLLAALEDGEIAAAGLDVLETEPPSSDHPLFDRDDTLVTPHVGWFSEAAKRDLNDALARDIARAFGEDTPKGLVDPSADWL